MLPSSTWSVGLFSESKRSIPSGTIAKEVYTLLIRLTTARHISAFHSVNWFSIHVNCNLPVLAHPQPSTWDKSSTAC